jgi:phosphoesterase RecJ-like protein
MIDFNLLDEIIIQNKSFVLTTHVNPDADAIGSEIAFYHILKSFNKQVSIINHSSTPYNLIFLDKENVIEKFNYEIHSETLNNADVIVLLDLNNLSRTVSMRDSIENSKSKKICIDHHQSPDNSADFYFLDTKVSATGEIIFDFLMAKHKNLINNEVVVPLYAAIMTDTGSFRFERTTPKLHRDIAFLIEKGANPVEIYDKIYDQSKFSKLKLLGRSLNSIKLLHQNKFAYMIITQQDFIETEAEESDTDNFVNYNLSIENVVLGLLFIELKNGFKVSFRSKGDVRVDLLAKKFGGGGHKNAAGARFYHQEMNQEIINNILENSIEYLKSIGV